MRALRLSFPPRTLLNNLAVRTYIRPRFISSSITYFNVPAAQLTNSAFIYIYNRHRLSKRDLSIMASTTSIPTERSVQDLEADIAAQKAIFNDLRAHGAPLQDAKKQLADLQKTLALVKGFGKEKEKKTEGSGGAQQQVDGQQQPKKKERLLLKTAKVGDLSRRYHNATDGRLCDVYRVQGTMVLQRCSVENTSSALSRIVSQLTEARASIPRL
jgi:hypothetical protein